mgnify:CR=1 FL=1
MVASIMANLFKILSLALEKSPFKLLKANGLDLRPFVQIPPKHIPLVVKTDYRPRPLSQMKSCMEAIKP